MAYWRRATRWASVVKLNPQLSRVTSPRTVSPPGISRSVYPVARSPLRSAMRVRAEPSPAGVADVEVRVAAEGEWAGVQPREPVPVVGEAHPASTAADRARMHAAPLIRTVATVASSSLCGQSSAD